jgi:hypothetical protein
VANSRQALRMCVASRDLASSSTGDVDQVRSPLHRNKEELTVLVVVDIDSVDDQLLNLLECVAQFPKMGQSKNGNQVVVFKITWERSQIHVICVEFEHKCTPEIDLCSIPRQTRTAMDGN